jgi:hypothetical protein
MKLVKTNENASGLISFTVSFNHYMYQLANHLMMAHVTETCSG